MGTLKSEFVRLALEMFEEFADFGISSTIVKTGAWDDDLQSSTTTTSSEFFLIPLEDKKSQFDLQNIQIGDLVVIGERQKITYSGSLMEFGISDSYVIFGGKNYSIVDIYIDAAQATIQMHLRLK